MLHGRIGRLPYALGVALWGMAAILAFFVGFTVVFVSDSPRSGYVVWTVTLGLLAVPPLPLHVRRLHDAGLSGWIRVDVLLTAPGPTPCQMAVRKS